MIKQVYSFFFFLIISCAVVFSTHLFILHHFNKPYFDNMIVEAYSFNIISALIIYVVIIILSKSKAHIIGFVFMASSLVKFGMFFLIFFPEYRLDDKINRIEFLTFFVPYAVCLVLETFFLVKRLNNQPQPLVKQQKSEFNK